MGLFTGMLYIYAIFILSYCMQMYELKYPPVKSYIQALGDRHLVAFWFGGKAKTSARVKNECRLGTN